MIQIRWPHLMLLWLAKQQGGTLRYSDVIDEKSPDSSLVNRWLSENGVGDIYTRPITHTQTQQNLYKSLHDLGLIDRPGFTLTEKGAALANQLGDDWRHWPALLPFENDEPVWEQAKRFPS